MSKSACLKIAPWCMAAALVQSACSGEGVRGAVALAVDADSAVDEAQGAGDGQDGGIDDGAPEAVDAVLEAGADAVLEAGSDAVPEVGADAVPEKPTLPLPFSTSFTEPAWDDEQWQEYDGAAGGAGANAGLVRQQGALTIGGNDKWGSNGLATRGLWSRSLGDLHFSATVTPQTCQGIYGYALGFGDFSHAAYHAEGPGAGYRVYLNGGHFRLRYTEWKVGKEAEVAQEATLKDGACTAGKPTELHLLVREGAGARAWIGANSAIAVELKVGSFDFKPMWVQHYSAGSTMTVSAAAAIRPVGLPGAPTSLSLAEAKGFATLQWAAPRQNGSAIIDYVIRCSNALGQDLLCDTAVSAATSAKLVLPAGQPYQVRITAQNGVGLGPESAPVIAMPLASQPEPPVAFQLEIK